MKSMLSAAGLATVLLFSWGAQAQDRYVEPPPVLVSPDLSAPWVMQLRSSPVLAQHRTQQAVEYRTYQRARNARERDSARRDYRPRHQMAVRGEQQKKNAQKVAFIPRASEPFPLNERSWRMSDPKWLPQVVEYETDESPGTIVVDTRQRFLFLVLKGGKAKRYGVGVGKEGFGWTGTEKVSNKRKWPDWHPPAEMIEREKAKGRILPVKMEGGPANPLGARALYLGSTLYRIHGTNAPWTIGRAVSSGCIRMRNEDVVDLYNRIPVGTNVVVK
ncbi:L,D-transpeptidase [Nitratireductor sp. L1-7-SE]|uniref:L,D-transpeptidase n=1 Tax=Nitratireductor rhodophyticola TaxID=2854036 RepID=A0ABS7R7D6_9HYPH|nr:L,D-transpeptidase [Nitratireductor rhodophyticola]MBY8916848.1 L,D-transpeptidase [Nitratireductor rhodophyticola]MBY8920723.1 L,D-transpeptidase [Nitratireductor rhodophyticola]